MFPGKIPKEKSIWGIFSNGLLNPVSQGHNLTPEETIMLIWLVKDQEMRKFG